MKAVRVAGPITVHVTAIDKTMAEATKARN